MKALIIAEHNGEQLSSHFYNTVTAAKQLSEQVDVLVAGMNCEAVIEQAAQCEQVTRVLHVDHQCYEYPLAENMAALIHAVASDYGYILAAASSFGKNILPRVAALLDVEQLSDITGIESADCFIRPIYAGNAVAHVKSNDAIKVITVRSTAFAAAKSGGGNGEIVALDHVFENNHSQFIEKQQSDGERPELTSAKIVIAGGRGLQSAENFKLLEQLADKLGAAIGASRAAVDAGFVPNDYQIGQTGKIVAPELYIAIGISGAVQHLAGIKDSKIIVAINKDKDAPIFKVADYGLVGDLFDIVPDLQAKL